jgi:hypothetical protein
MGGRDSGFTRSGHVTADRRWGTLPRRKVNMETVSTLVTWSAVLFKQHEQDGPTSTHPLSLLDNERTSIHCSVGEPTPSHIMPYASSVGRRPHSCPAA